MLKVKPSLTNSFPSTEAKQGPGLQEQTGMDLCCPASFPGQKGVFTITYEGTILISQSGNPSTKKKKIIFKI